MVLAGLLADKCFRRRLKEMVIFCFVASALVTALVTAQFATPWRDSALWAAPKGAVGATLFAAGVLSGMLDPLCLELAAEVGFPTSEATSSGLLTLVYNAAALVVLSLLIEVLWCAWNPTGDDVEEEDRKWPCETKTSSGVMPAAVISLFNVTYT
jgi:sugar phosphate permease